MEKVVSVLWKPPERGEAEYAAELLSLAPSLREAGAIGLRVSVVDDAVAAGEKVRVGRMDPPKSAFVSFWQHMADDAAPILSRLGELSARQAAYLVVESVPMQASHTAGAGERCPGFNFVTCIEPKQGLAYDEFLAHWHHEHREVAFETQSTTAYVRNEIVRPLVAGAPGWAAVVEESFPSEALTDPEVWYAAVGSPERLDANRRRMIESCVAFLAMDRIEAHPMSEYVFA